MRKDLQDRLFERYPKIFARRTLPSHKSMMCFGIETGDGRWWLIDALCGCIQHHVDSTGGSLQVEAVQVKEKFGGLRFYVDSADDEVFGMIALTESLSLRVCESCGSTRDVSSSGRWIRTLCNKCRNQPR